VCVQLIKEGKRYDDLTEVAKLFSLHGADVLSTADEEVSQTAEPQASTAA